jgi:hypothetical protein
MLFRKRLSKYRVNLVLFGKGKQGAEMSKLFLSAMVHFPVMLTIEIAIA